MKKNGNDKTNRVPLTDEMRKKLLSLKESTGVGPSALFTYGKKYTNKEVFHNISSSNIYQWLNNAETVCLDDFNTIIEVYESLNIVPLTPDMTKAVLALKEKTGYGYQALFKFGKNNTQHPVFRNATSNQAMNWFSGKKQVINPDDYKAIVDTYKAILMLSNDKVTLTTDMQKEIITLRESTGVSYNALYEFGKKHTQYPVFQETNKSLIMYWLANKGLTINAKHFSEIIDTFKRLDDGFYKGEHKPSRANHVEISQELLLKLRTFIDTPRQLTLQKILLYSNAPKGLTEKTIKNIARGNTPNVKISYVEFLERLLKE